MKSSLEEDLRLWRSNGRSITTDEIFSHVAMEGNGEAMCSLCGLLAECHDNNQKAMNGEDENSSEQNRWLSAVAVTALMLLCLSDFLIGESSSRRIWGCHFLNFHCIVCWVKCTEVSTYLYTYV